MSAQKPLMLNYEIVSTFHTMSLPFIFCFEALDVKLKMVSTLHKLPLPSIGSEKLNFELSVGKHIS